MRRLFIGVALGLAVVAVAGATWWTNQSHSCRDLGRVGSYREQSVSRVDCFPAFVVRRQHELYVLLGYAPHLEGETVVWDDARQRFYSPSHGEEFDATGAVLMGPARHGMWRCPYVLRDDRILIGSPSDVTPDQLVAACKRNGHA